MKTVYALSAFYPDTSSMGFLGTLDTEEAARAYAMRGTQDTGNRKAIKIVRQEAGAKSGEVIAFYMRGVEVSCDETFRAE